MSNTQTVTNTGDVDRNETEKNEKKEKKDKKKKISDTHLAKAADNTCQVPDCIIM